MNDDLAKTMSAIEIRALSDASVTNGVVARTIKFIADLHATVTSDGYEWCNPHVTTSDGDFDFEWIRPNHRLIVGWEDDGEQFVFGVSRGGFGFEEFERAATGYAWWCEENGE